MTLSPFCAGAVHGRAPAWIFGDEVVSFDELATRVARTLGWLEARGVDLGASAPVAVVGRSDRATLCLVYALFEAGIPALLVHPRLTEPERDELIRGARPALSFDSTRDGDPSASTAAPASMPRSPLHDEAAIAERPLAIVYTSGSTDRPKGVVLSRRAFVASAEASASNLGWRDDDRWLLSLPVAHVGGLSILTRCLIAGRPLVLPPKLERDRRLGPDAWLTAVRRYHVTIASVVPTQLDAILARTPPLVPPRSLRALLVGGAAASPRLLERAADRGFPVLTTYGLTEACSQVTTQGLGTTNRGERGAGRPLPGIELGVEADGTLRLRGPMLFSGYLTEGGIERAVDDQGWFRTTDIGQLDADGCLHILGRKSERIITGGENVSPAEVERVLEDLPGIAAACVFGDPDERWGEIVCAALVAARDEPAPESYEPLVRSALAPHKRPRQVA